VVGLVAAPIVGAKQEGAAGFAKGIATGEQQQQQQCSAEAYASTAHKWLTL
jgi:hypothetical protein